MGSTSKYILYSIAVNFRWGAKYSWFSNKPQIFCRTKITHYMWYYTIFVHLPRHSKCVTFVCYRECMCGWACIFLMLWRSQSRKPRIFAPRKLRIQLVRYQWYIVPPTLAHTTQSLCPQDTHRAIAHLHSHSGLQYALQCNLFRVHGDSHRIRLHLQPNHS